MAKPPPDPVQALLEAYKAEVERRTAETHLAYATANAEQIREESRSLLGFVKHAWHVLEPNTVLLIEMPVEAICEHLQAVSNREINRLWVNVAPGNAKSLLLNVLWPAYEWGPMASPWLRYVATSGDESLTTRDGKKFRDLITSPWYKQLWPEVEMTSLSIGEMNNTKTGARYGVPFSGMTGWRGHRLCIDDPHNLKNEKSDAMRQETVRLFRESASSRLNDVTRDAIVGVMQMVGPDDLSNYVKQDSSYTYLCIPQEFERERRCVTYRKDGTVLWTDPRRTENELASPKRFPREWVEKEKSPKEGIGSFAFAAQHQQNAISRIGGMFQKDWFKDKILKPWELEKFNIVRTVRWFDLADTDIKAAKTGGARTAGVKVAMTKNRDFIVLHAKAFGLSGAKKDAEIKRIVDMDPQNVEICFPADAASGGKVQGRAMATLCAGRNVKIIKESGDKVARAEPFSSQCEAGNVFLLEGNWNEEWLDEVCMFPQIQRKDLVDASANAFNQLLAKRVNQIESWPSAMVKIMDPVGSE